jgi:hypothetical protein
MSLLKLLTAMLCAYWLARSSTCRGRRQSSPASCTRPRAAICWLLYPITSVFAARGTRGGDVASDETSVDSQRGAGDLFAALCTAGGIPRRSSSACSASVFSRLGSGEAPRIRTAVARAVVRRRGAGISFDGGSARAVLRRARRQLPVLRPRIAHPFRAWARSRRCCPESSAVQ